MPLNTEISNEPLYLKFPDIYSSYPVQQGDTIESLAKSLFGNSRNWGLIAAENGLVFPYKLIPGTLLSIKRSDIINPPEPTNLPLTKETPVNIPEINITKKFDPFQQLPFIPALTDTSPWWRKNLHWLILGVGASLLLLSFSNKK